jgi:lysyl-tRNA synthetase, class II
VPDDFLSARREKLERLRAEGVEPFPHVYEGVEPIASVLLAHEGLEAGEDSDATHRVAGRLAARRGQGKMAWLDLVDRSGRIQLQSRVDVLGPESHERLLSLDLGDLVGVDGSAFRSKRGELSLRVTRWELLAKSLRPPPDKYHGLHDVETRYRQRELDLMANEDTRDLFLLRARVIAAVRRFLDEHGFVEVETPVLQPLYGGAMARPFTTHYNALDSTFYLRIATELYLKRLIVGGLERVYELGKDFRNEGLSPKHNPEFTMVEFYEAYADYRLIAERCEQLVAYAAHTVGYAGPLDFTPPWRRETLQDAIRDRTGIDVLAHRDRDALQREIEAKGLEVPPEDTWAQLVDALLSRYVEPDLQQPTFLLDYPVELSPFAKGHREVDGLVERFEAFAGGIEIANAFTELNDPDEQRARFEEQTRAEAAGDEQAHPYDEGFVRALEHGMPPTGGIGIGIDRLVMLLSGRGAIREVVLFPALRDS